MEKSRLGGGNSFVGDAGNLNLMRHSIGNQCNCSNCSEEFVDRRMEPQYDYPGRDVLRTLKTGDVFGCHAEQNRVGVDKQLFLSGTCASCRSFNTDV